MPEKFIIPNGAVEIKQNHFYDRDGSEWEIPEDVTSINIPDSVKKIGNSAFDKCSSLTEIEIPGPVKKIGDRAFDKCSSLREINIPDSVKKIGNCAY